MRAELRIVFKGARAIGQYGSRSSSVMRNKMVEPKMVSETLSHNRRETAEPTIKNGRQDTLFRIRLPTVEKPP